ncbi:MAG: hypothetical protein V1754_01745 [Pseudomonadota bacterium]
MQPTSEKFRRLTKIFFAGLLLGAISCKGSTPGTDGGTLTDGGQKSDAALPLESPTFPNAFVVITDPTGQIAITTDQAEITVSGRVVGDITSLAYTLASEASPEKQGTIDIKTKWEFTEQLVAGDNVITVTAIDKEANETQDSLTVTYNPAFPMGTPTTTPAQIIKGAGTSILFAIEFKDIYDLVEDTTKVVVVDEKGVPTGEEIVALKDDGTNGDEFEGDWVFSAKALIDDSEDKVYSLRIVADTDGENGSRVAYSEVFTVEVISPFATEEVDDLETTSDLVANKYEEYAKTLNSEEAAAKAVDDLLQNAQVEEAGVSPTGYTIWWRMKNGANAAFNFYPLGTKGTCNQPPDPVKNVSKSTAILLEPYQEEFGTEAEIDQIETLLKGAICPAYDPILKKEDANATLDDFRKMDEYGVVVISSHGGVWKNEVFFSTEVKIERTHLTDPNSQYLRDYRAQPPRLTWTSHRVGSQTVYHWALLPAFVYHYNTKFPKNAIVHSATCSGAKNQTMAAAFLAGGAEIYSGFTNTVSNVYGLAIIVSYFRALVQGQTVKEAWNTARREAGKVDPKYTSTQFVYTPASPGDITLIEPCYGYTMITDRREYVFSGSANKKEESNTYYYSSDKVIKSPYDPFGNTFVLQNVHKTCSFDFVETSTLPNGGPIRKESGVGALTENHIAKPDFQDFDPEARYGVVKFVINREANEVQFYPTPEGACWNHDDWVLRTVTSYAFSHPETFQEMGTCSFWGGIADIPGYNNDSDYILFTSPNVQITDKHISGSMAVSNDEGEGQISFYYEIAPK